MAMFLYLSISMNSSIIKAAFAYILSSFCVQGVAFASQLLLMRWFSVSQYGEYALAFEALAVCNLVINGAFRNYYLKSIRDGIDYQDLLSYQLLFGSLWCGVAGVIVALLFKIEFSISIAICISMVLSSLFLPVNMEYLAKGRKWRLIIRDVFNSISTLALSFLLIKLGFQEAKPFIFSVLLSQVVVNFIVFFRFRYLKRILNFTLIKNVKLSIIPFFGVFIVNTIYNKLGVTFVNLKLGIVDVAVYLAAFKFITPFYAVQAALISAVMPKFTSAEKFKFNCSFFMFFALPGAIASILLILLFPTMISIFSLHKYDGLFYLMKYAGVVIFVVFIYGALSNYIAVNGGQKYIIITNVAGVIFYSALLCLGTFYAPENNLLVFSIGFFVITECIVCILYYFNLKKSHDITFLFLLSPILIIIYESYMLMA